MAIGEASPPATAMTAAQGRTRQGQGHRFNHIASPAGQKACRRKPAHREARAGKRNDFRATQARSQQEPNRTGEEERRGKQRAGQTQLTGPFNAPLHAGMKQPFACCGNGSWPFSI
ncbi:hypothetical protein AB2N04_15595 [Nitratireductor sp. GISD-1A_MAKvit]|uniref:hypothetical protein n=1 Tax=Nitratireductor sp. GISD-1A_MAKvit TaxID=3234198 RepID=UPI003467E93F